jgi:hypothetical protein
MVQKDKQRSTKHTHKTKDRVTRTPLKTEGEIRCFERVSSSCSTSGTLDKACQALDACGWFSPDIPYFLHRHDKAGILMLSVACVNLHIKTT